MSVKKYRKKPVEIEAMQYDGRNTVEVAEWLAESGVEVGWSNAEMVIPTLEGRMHATPGDWIIRGVQGEFYPCKPDIFEKTYEASEQAEAIDRMGPAAGCAYCVGAGGYEDYDGEWHECVCQLADREPSDAEVEAAADAIVEASFGQELPEAPIDLARAALIAAQEVRDES